MATVRIPAERHHYITKLIRKRSIVTVAELSKALEVSDLTVRRDLHHLEKHGILERTHGGAVATRRQIGEGFYDYKNQVDQREKEAIGRASAELVENGDTLLVNAGSSTHQVLNHLDRTDVLVITNSLNAVAALRGKNVKLILTGGNYSPHSNSVSGSFAEMMLGQVYGSKAIIGVDGISCRYGITTANQQEADINRCFIARTTGPKIVVASRSKFGVVSNFVSGSIKDIDIVVTDSGFDEAYRECIEAAGVKIVIA